MTNDSKDERKTKNNKGTCFSFGKWFTYGATGENDL